MCKIPRKENIDKASRLKRLPSKMSKYSAEETGIFHPSQLLVISDRIQGDQVFNALSVTDLKIAINWEPKPCV